MILDKLLCFFDGDSIGTGTSKESSSLNLGTSKPGMGEPLHLWIDGTGVAGNSTVTVELEHADTATGSYSTVVRMDVALATLNNGFAFPIPADCKQYTKLKLSGSSNFTAGTLLACIVKDFQAGLV